MEEFKFDSLEDVQNVVNNFYKLPIRSRMLYAHKVNLRLKELDGYVKVNSENPILNYPSERFIVNSDKTENEYSKFENLLNEDVEMFNYKIYNDISLSLDNITGIYDIVRLCREQNNKADDLYLKKFPSHKDLIAVFKQAVSKIEMCILYDFVEDIAVNSMNDIEFIISTNMLSNSHVRRLLLAPMRLFEMQIFQRTLSNYAHIKQRLVALFNSQITLVKQRRDEFMMLRPFNDNALRAYLKIQKIGYEETLLDKEFNGDYDPSDNFFATDMNIIKQIDTLVKKEYPVQPINMIDKFKLEQHGIKPIMNKVSDGKEYYIHSKKGIQYVLYKSKRTDSIYYMITKLNGDLKSYKITITDKKPVMDEVTANTILESTFITNYKKMNR